MSGIHGHYCVTAESNETDHGPIFKMLSLAYTLLKICNYVILLLLTPPEGIAIRRVCWPSFVRVFVNMLGLGAEYLVNGWR